MKKKYKHGFGTASFLSYKYFLFNCMYLRWTICLPLTFHELYFHSPYKINKELLDRSVWNWNQSLFNFLRVKIVFINMAAYSNIELTNIHYMYGRASGNCREAQRLYQQIFLQKQYPVKNTFTSVHHRLRETIIKKCL